MGMGGAGGDLRHDRSEGDMAAQIGHAKSRGLPVAVGGSLRQFDTRMPPN